MDVTHEIHAIAERARAAARTLAPATREQKDRALREVAGGLRREAALVLDANTKDLDQARERGTKGALLDRLTLNASRLEAVACSVESIATLDDPVGTVLEKARRPNGLVVSRVRVPLGVIAMIYEARPNVTAEASALTLKSGNAVILRGGSEAIHTNLAIAQIVRKALVASGLPVDAVQLVPFTDRDGVRALVQESELVDLAIPRGGEALIRSVTEQARVPVVQHYKGVCHLFVDRGADLEQATRIVVDAKLSRPGVCNALECLLIDRGDKSRLWPPLARALRERGCELRCDAEALELLATEKGAAAGPAPRPATEGDWGQEFLDAILAVRVVDGLEGALEHVRRYGSGHTEAIVSPSAAHQARWRQEVDAACVVVNASTRFHDGGELGLGAEIGIATSRLHWRGPMGLESLTTHRWVVEGQGQVRG